MGVIVLSQGSTNAYANGVGVIPPVEHEQATLLLTGSRSPA